MHAFSRKCLVLPNLFFSSVTPPKNPHQRKQDNTALRIICLGIIILICTAAFLPEHLIYCCDANRCPFDKVAIMYHPENSVQLNEPRRFMKEPSVRFFKASVFFFKKKRSRQSIESGQDGGVGGGGV